MSNLRDIPGAIAMPPSLGEALGASKVPTTTTVKHAPVGESAVEIFGGALNDTFQTGNARAAADPLGRAVFQPKNIGEAAVREAIMAPVSAVSMPARLAASAASGPIAALGSGRSLGDAGWSAVLDAAVAGVTEAGGAGVAKLAGKVGAPARAFAWATEAPAKALEFVRTRLPKGAWLNVPSLSTSKLTAEEAVGKLAKSERAQYEVARAEIAHEMNRLDAQRLTGPKPLAGQVFKHMTEPERYAPSRKAKVAEGIAKAARGPKRLEGSPARGLADVAATTPIDEGQLPEGLLGVLGAAQAPAHLLRHIPGLGRVLDAVPAQ